MKQRSPVLGYNHNLRHAGRLWHVQTEDSGVQNPHIFTHLFHQGTILASKKLDYDASAEIDVVQKLMQSQHKAMMRELKAGTFDDKIAKFFGMPVDGDGDAAPAPEPPGPPPPASPPQSAAPARPDAEPALSSPPASPSQTQPGIARPAVPGAAAAGRSKTSPRPAAAPIRKPSTRPELRPAPSMNVVVARRKTTYRPGAGMSEQPAGNVVARPTRVVGAPAGARPTPAQPAAPSGSGAPAGDNIFGGPVPEKSLDDVILAYLSDDLTDKR